MGRNAKLYGRIAMTLFWLLPFLWLGRHTRLVILIPFSAFAIIVCLQNIWENRTNRLKTKAVFESSRERILIHDGILTTINVLDMKFSTDLANITEVQIQKDKHRRYQINFFTADSSWWKKFLKIPTYSTPVDTLVISDVRKLCTDLNLMAQTRNVKADEEFFAEN